MLSDLGTRLTGDRSAFDYDGPEAVFDELTRVAPTHAGVSYADLDAGGRQWPVDSDGVLYRQRFGTADGLVPFGSARPTQDPNVEDGLTLVTGGRMSEFADDDFAAVLKLAPEDANRRGIESGDTVLVSDGETELRARASVDAGTRARTVYLPATVADPLLRGKGSAVRVRLAASADSST